MSDATSADRPKKDRSPSFPFISLRRAVERAQQFSVAHKREPARLAAVALTWAYGIKSSGLLQTVAALKQYGLLEDVSGGDERKVKLTDLARSILSDARPGVKENALKTAANNPKLFNEYISRWVPEPPADSHCLSELEHDRGFTPEAAKVFLKALKITINYAGLSASDSMSSSLARTAEQEDESEVEPSALTQQANAPAPKLSTNGRVPYKTVFNSADGGEPFQLTFLGSSIRIEANLTSAEVADDLVRAINALKVLLRKVGTVKASEAESVS